MQLSSVLIPLVLKGDVLKQRLWGGLGVLPVLCGLPKQLKYIICKSMTIAVFDVIF